MEDLKALAATVKPFRRIEELKQLPILYVLERAGIPFEEVGGIYRSASPFRYDEHPSFDVYGPDLERWGDFAEGTSGDVLDLLGRFLETTGMPNTLIAQKDWASRLLDEYLESGWDGPTQGAERKAFDLAEAREYLDHTTADEAVTEAAVYEWQQTRTDRLREVDTGFLVSTFKLGFDGERILIPYFDQSGELAAYKTRRPGSPVFSAESASFDNLLYGIWLDDGVSTVVLCEGESDVWSGTHAASSGYVVLGLPTGAGSQPKQARLLTGRRVILAFDGDPSGRDATSKWAMALEAVKAEVLIAYVPTGEDVSSLSEQEFGLLVDTALPTRPRPDDAPTAMDGGVGYERITQRGVTQISDWTFVPTEVLVGEEGVSWNGLVLPIGKQVVLRAHDLSSKPNIIRWSTLNGSSWFGSDRDAQLLGAYFHSISTFLPRGRAVSYTGLHDDIVVYPGGKLGSSNYVYVPGKIDIPLASMVHLDDSLLADPSPLIPLALRGLHTTAVMDPILAWLAVAPLRSRLGQFPILAVTGGSGTGKTTLVREVVRHFTATQINTNLTGTTKFAMLGYMGATNAFPVWFDEYRPGARKETLVEFNQLLRDAYTGQSSIKGGMGDSWATVREVAVRAPIVVSGEDAFSETSHTERMILLNLPRDGKNTEAMPAAIALDTTGFAARYYDWIRTQPTPVVVAAGPETLPDRQRYNLGVLVAGWDMLGQFMFEEAGYTDWPEMPDLSLVIAEGQEAAESNPILEAVQWAMEEPRLQMDHVVMQVDDRVHIRVEALVAAVNRAGTFTLPGGSKAVGKYLRSHLDGHADYLEIAHLDRKSKIRTVSIPASVVASDL